MLNWALALSPKQPTILDLTHVKATKPTFTRYCLSLAASVRLLRLTCARTGRLVYVGVSGAASGQGYGWLLPHKERRPATALATILFTLVLSTMHLYEGAWGTEPHDPAHLLPLRGLSPDRLDVSELEYTCTLSKKQVPRRSSGSDSDCLHGCAVLEG